MIQQVRGYNLGLSFDEKYYLDTSSIAIAFTMKKPWGCADYEDTYTGIWELTGTEPRTPGNYGTDTGESVHECVDARLDFNKGKPNPWAPPPGITGMPRDHLGILEENLKKKYPST
jgi:hypothetical protein